MTNPVFWAAFIFILLLCVTSAHNNGRDENDWSYMGWMWATQGLPPYQCTFENKTPGIFLLHAVCFALFGASIWAVRVLGIIATTGAALMLYRLGDRIGNRFAGLFSMILFGLSMSWVVLNGWLPGWPESFLVFFTILSFLLLVRGFTGSPAGAFSCFLGAGASVSMAIQFKQIAVADAAAILGCYCILAHRARLPATRWIRDTSAMVLGGLAAGLLLSLPLIASGVSFRDYQECVMSIVFAQRQSARPSYEIVQILDIWMDSQLVILAAPLVLFFLVRKQLSTRVPVSVVLLWLLLAFLGADAAGRIYGHQVRQAMPPLAIVCGLGLSGVLRALVTRGLSEQAMVRVLILLMVVTGIPYNNLLMNAGRAVLPLPIDPAVAWLRQETSPREPVYVWSEVAGRILLQSQRKTSSRFFNISLAWSSMVTEGLRKDMEARLPRVIVVAEADAKNMPPWLQGTIATRFVLKAALPGYLVFEKVAEAAVPPVGPPDNAASPATAPATWQTPGSHSQ